MTAIHTETEKSTAGHNAKAQLLSIIERVERLEQEKKSISDDVKDIYKEAEANGWDAKALRTIVRIRAMDQQKRQEQEALVNTYKATLGMLDDDAE